MARRRQFIPVPLFTAYQIRLANLCALDLWNGVDFETGEQMEFSDKDMLVTFSTPFHHIIQNQNTPQNITEYDIRCLIRVARLKAMYRSANPTDFQNGISTIRNHVAPTFRSFQSGLLRVTAKDCITNTLLDLASSFVTSVANPTKRGNYRVPLASRILFYAVPYTQMFNFSCGLADAMNFQKRPQDAFPYFMDAMLTGLQRNRRLLSKLLAPQITLAGQDAGNRLPITDWWQRRVLDLALLIFFNQATPRIQLQQQASAPRTLRATHVKVV